MIQTFGKYQILEHVATGSVAEIYKARQEGIGGFQRTYAIKRILPELSQNADYIAMLVDEAKVAGLLTHANIVQIVDLGQVEDRWYIAMEYVHGKDLGAVLARARERGLTLPVPHTAFVAIELLKGLEYAHQRQVMRGGRPVALNIIHRDVSPANVLLSFQGEVKLTDFGLARASLKAMENGGGGRGRYDYMSPEQVSAAKEIDQRTDLFSVGVLLYEMITGRHPFRQETDAATLEALRAGRYTPITRHNPDVPLSLETIVARALQPNRDDRFPSATAFKEALDQFFHEQGFIFTHATLASYVRGLFGEGAQRNVSKTGESAQDGASETPPTVARPTGTATVAAAPPVKPRKSPTVRRVDATRASESPSGGVVNVEQDVELVSRNAGSRPPPEPEPAKKRGAKPAQMTPLDGSLARATPIAQLLDDVDHATVIRKGEPSAPPAKARKKTSSLSEDDMATRQLHPDRDIDHATVLRKASSAEDLLRPPESAESVVAEPGAKPVDGSPLAPNPGQRRRGMGWLPLGAALFGMILGVGATVALTPVVTDFVGQLHRWGITVVPVPDERMPRIEVIAPRDAEILLDGEAVGKVVTVEPYVVHHLTVRPRGLEPWTRDLELGLDEARVFVVSPVHAREKQGNPEATRQAAASPTAAE